MVQKQHCRASGWSTPDMFWHECYSDIPVLYSSARLGGPGSLGPLEAVRSPDLGQPPLDPPVIRSSFQGFRAVPKWGLMVVGAAANSWVSVLPSMTAPARRRRAMHSASSDGTWFRKKLDPFVVRTPAVSMMSFIP